MMRKTKMAFSMLMEKTQGKALRILAMERHAKMALRMAMEKNGGEGAPKTGDGEKNEDGAQNGDGQMHLHISHMFPIDDDYGN